MLHQYYLMCSLERCDLFLGVKGEEGIEKGNLGFHSKDTRTTVISLVVVGLSGRGVFYDLFFRVRLLQYLVVRGFRVLEAAPCP